MSNKFEELESLLNEGGQPAVIDRLIEQLRESKSYHELFEALKMRLRREIGLQVLYGESGDELDEPQRTQLEEGLLSACRDVGESLLRDGRIREGWMYLRPVGETDKVASLLSEVEADEDNLDELVEVCLHEGVDTARGYSLVLDNYGTCNAITTFESIVHQRPQQDQQAAAGLLVKHVHAELSQSLRADVSQQEGEEPAEENIEQLVEDRDWLFGEHSYHIDTTHLASTIRFAKLSDDSEIWRLALDMTHYGRRLNEQFQYQGDEPFVDLYPSHALYFKALLGDNEQEAVDYFRDKAKSVDVNEWGAAAIDVYVDLLSRLGRHADAIQAAIQLTPSDAQPTGQAPSLLELSQQAGDFQTYLEFCRGKDDLLGFATGLLLKS